MRTLHKATEELTAQNNPKTFLVHSIPFITNTVLAPHIKSFKALYPDVAISIESKIDRVDISDAMLQIALRHGSDDSDGLIYDKICDVQISPICTPDYLKQDKKTLLQLSTDSTSWDIWNSDWNTKIDFDDTLYCDGMQAIVEMAAQGVGNNNGILSSNSTPVK